MDFDEKIGSSVLPVREGSKPISIDDIEREILNTFAKKGFKYINDYNKYSVKCTNTVLKDLITNLEELLKPKFINEEKNLFISNIMFDVIRQQFKVIESLDDKILTKDIAEEVCVVIIATIFSYFKKHFS